MKHKPGLNLTSNHQSMARYASHRKKMQGKRDGTYPLSRTEWVLTQAIEKAELEVEEYFPEASWEGKPLWLFAKTKWGYIELEPKGYWKPYWKRKLRFLETVPHVLVKRGSKDHMWGQLEMWKMTRRK